MVVREVAGQEPPQMSLVQHDHVTQAFAADTPDQPFDIGVLLGTPGRDQHLFNPHIMDALSKVCPVNAVAIPQKIPRDLIPRKGFDHLS
jgi:hypothetical protein